MVFFKILYRGGIEQRLSILSDAEKRFKEGDNLIEVHLGNEKVLIHSLADLELYKTLGFYAYKEMVERR